MPETVEKVVRSDIHYTVDPNGNPHFNVVARVNPSLDNYDPLVEEVMRKHGIAGEISFRVAAPSYSAGLEAALKRRDFQVRDEADCWSIDVNQPRPAIPEHTIVRRVETLEGLKAMEEVLNTCFDHHNEPTDEDSLGRFIEGCTGDNARCRRYVAFDTRSGQPIATGAFNLYPRPGLGFMWGGATIPEARGRGVYSAVITTRMNDARALGMKRIGLYALRKTSGPIIERQGFEKHGPVTFWFRDLSAPDSSHE
jgi:hypothetical protein